MTSIRSTLTAQNFWVWFGGLWFAVGSPFLILGIYLGVQQADVSHRFEAEGKIVDGMVLTKARRTSQSSSKRAGGTTYEVTFRYLTPAGMHTATAQVSPDTWDRLVERESVPVTYLPDAPQQHRIEGETSGWWLPGLFTTLGAIFAGSGGVMLLKARSRTETKRRLMRQGVSATATVTAVGEASMRINGVPQWAVRYEYQDERGATRRGTYTCSPEEAGQWSVGDRVAIRFDRRRPDHSLWIGS